jgi:Flp pilus assembly protein TadD
MKIKLLAIAAFAVLPAAVVVSYAGDASACGSAIRLDPTPQKPTPVQEIARAEKALESGQNLVAAKAILGNFPKIRTVTAGQTPLETRALRVFSLAVVRSNGSVTEKSAGFASQGEWLPTANLEWAVQSLREIDQSRPNDPTVQADLGEALSKLAHGQAEALTILQGLAQKDLMGSPHAYAALAKLRTNTGDTSGAEAAIKRCEEMSKTPGVCKPATPAAAPPPKPAPATVAMLKA